MMYFDTDLQEYLYIDEKSVQGNNKIIFMYLIPKNLLIYPYNHVCSYYLFKLQSVTYCKFRNLINHFLHI